MTNERKGTVKRRLTCCCCGGDAGRWKQWWNRDTGYGICYACVKLWRAKGEDVELSCGKEGVNWGEFNATG
jgi:hypothetical protein